MESRETTSAAARQNRYTFIRGDFQTSDRRLNEGERAQNDDIYTRPEGLEEDKTERSFFHDLVPYVFSRTP